MKWGVRKASYKLNANKRLKKKALELDAKSAKLYKKSEKAHASYDLERSNKAATKAANYAKKSVKAQKKANKETNGLAKTMYERKAAKMTYKSEKAKLDANRLSRSTGYGGKAMKLAVKSDKAAIKAAKVRMKLAKNEAYVAKMKQRIDEVSKTDVEVGKKYFAMLQGKTEYSRGQQKTIMSKEDAAMAKKLDAIESKYKKKFAAAKTQDERELLELDMMDELDKL